MDIKGGNELTQGPEMIPGLEAKRISRAELTEPMMRKLCALRYDMRDPKNNRGPGAERREALENFKKDFLHDNDNGAMFIAMKGEEIIGFLAVGKKGTEASAEIMWAETSGKPQRTIARKLISKAKEELQHRQTHLTLQSAAPSDQVRFVNSDPNLRNYFQRDSETPEIESPSITPEVHQEGVDEVVE